MNNNRISPTDEQIAAADRAWLEEQEQLAWMTEQQERERLEREWQENISLRPTNEPDLSYIRDAEADDSIFIVKSANDAILDSRRRPNPRALYDKLWYEGELCCLFADSNVGKSIYAMQIADHIAQTHRVLYFDFELSEKQFQLRYTDDHLQIHKFPKNLMRVEINPTAIALRQTPLEDIVVQSIEQLAYEEECSVVIIDNLTFLCMDSEKGDVAGAMMMKLLDLKRRSNLSVLVLAHTPKRPLDRSITQNDLAGSKKLFNFFDSAFAIGKSIKDESLRYVKQIKVRNGEFVYGAECVKVCEIVKDGALLKFADVGESWEREHLRECEESDVAKERERVLQLVAEGMSYRAIAAEMQISLGKISRLVNRGK